MITILFSYTILIKIFFLSWFIINFEPFKMILNFILVKMARLFKNKQNFYINMCSHIVNIFECYKCTNFWVALLLTGNIFIAAFMAFAGDWYKKLISKDKGFQKLNRK